MEKDLLLRPDLLVYGKLAQYGLGYCAGQIELTSECSQRCLYCQSWREHTKGLTKGTLLLGTIRYILNQLNDMPTFSHLSMTGGEPSLWRDPETGMNFEQLLHLINQLKLKFSIQVNTNLTESINFELWRKTLQRVRVSLDGVTLETYKKMRGVDENPKEILKKINELAHDNLSVMTCIAPENINEIPELIWHINGLEHPPRKIMCLAVLGTEIKPEFWEQYAKLKNIPSPRVPTSFMEDVVGVRDFCNSPEAEEIPCAVGKISFHIKCDGTLRTCCLAGGEAIQTQDFTNIGNVLTEPLANIQKRYVPKCHYKKGSLCSEVCQFKQLYVNRLVHASKKITLTMP